MGAEQTVRVEGLGEQAAVPCPTLSPLQPKLRLKPIDRHQVVLRDFDTLPHSPLMARVEGKVADGKVLGLVAAYLAAKVMETARGWTPEGGTPQGAVISPLLSNLYPDPLDHLLAGKGYEMVR